MTQRTPTARGTRAVARRSRRRFVLAVLASEAVIALLLRIAVGPPPAGATITAGAMAPLDAPAAPALIVACIQNDVHEATLRICAQL